MGNIMAAFGKHGVGPARKLVVLLLVLGPPLVLTGSFLFAAIAWWWAWALLCSLVYWASVAFAFRLLTGTGSKKRPDRRSRNSLP